MSIFRVLKAYTLNSPDEDSAEGGIAIEHEVIAEPGEAGAQQAVPEVLHQQPKRAPIIARCLQHRSHMLKHTTAGATNALMGCGKSPGEAGAHQECFNSNPNEPIIARCLQQRSHDFKHTTAGAT